MTVTIPYELWVGMVAFIRQQQSSYRGTDAPAGHEADRLMDCINDELRGEAR